MRKFVKKYLESIDKKGEPEQLRLRIEHTGLEQDEYELFVSELNKEIDSKKPKGWKVNELFIMLEGVVGRTPELTEIAKKSGSTR